MAPMSNISHPVPVAEFPSRLKQPGSATDSPFVTPERGRGLLYLLAIAASYVLFVGVAWAAASFVVGRGGSISTHGLGAFVVAAAALALLVFAVLLVRLRSSQLEERVEPVGEPDFGDSAARPADVDRLTA